MVGHCYAARRGLRGAASRLGHSCYNNNNNNTTEGKKKNKIIIIIIIIIITDLYSAFRSEDTEALGAAQQD